MIFNRPTLKDISVRISSDLGIYLGVSLPLERRSVLYAISQAFAGASYLIHGHLENITKNLFPDTAEGDALEAWARRTAIKRRPPSKARGFLKFSSDKNGVIIPKGKRVARNDSIFYLTKTQKQITNGFAVVEIEAEEAGSTSNTIEGTVLTLIESIAGVKSEALVEPPGVREGFDLESDASLRERILLSLSSPGSCGSEQDFILWSKEVVGVSKVFLNPNYLGVPSVGVSFFVDNYSAPIPTIEKIKELESHLKSKCPVGFGLTVFTLKANPILVELELPDFSDEDKRKALETLERDLKKFFFNESKPYGTISVPLIIDQIEKSLRGRQFVLRSPTTSTANTLEVIATFGGVKCT
jgi:uncharacterized phage protein gp47/JayE